MSRAPGRINIIGEHIDYNDGFVLPVAIDQYIVAAMSPNETNLLCRVHALDLGESISWNLDEPLHDRPVWLHYIYGSLMEWYQAGWAGGGLDILFSGEIPTGAGLSSSAALEASNAIGIASLWSITLDRKELALHCQLVEHKYAGVQCGIMDQYASIFGLPDQAILLDCRTVEHEYVPLELPDYSFLLVNSGVSHSLASSEYNLRRASCDEALAIIRTHSSDINSWREVDRALLSTVRKDLSDTTFKRALHVVNEIERVKQACKALASNDLMSLGLLIYQSHEDLSKNYEVSCPELDFLVDQARLNSDILGARMMGGGFGGCTINLIRNSGIEAFVTRTQLNYQRKFGFRPEVYIVHSGSGAELI